jgi:hypothetical protein
MTIDERIESLRCTVELQAESGKRLDGVTERLDVVTQKLEGVTLTVELLSHIHMELAQSHAETDKALKQFIKTMEQVNAVNTGILNRPERNMADHKEWLGTHSLALEKQQKAHDKDMAEIRKLFKLFLRGKRSNGRS